MNKEELLNSIFIHYGHRHLDRYKFHPIYNREVICKPGGGLWASLIEGYNNWIDWVIKNHFYIEERYNNKNWFKFKLKPSTKILYINNHSQLQNLPYVERNNMNTFIYDLFDFIDFEKLSGIYDAIYIQFSADSILYEKLDAWDCDTLLVFNIEKVLEIESSDDITCYKY